jgi:hypothetical protein
MSKGLEPAFDPSAREGQSRPKALDLGAAGRRGPSSEMALFKLTCFTPSSEEREGTLSMTNVTLTVADNHMRLQGLPPVIARDSLTASTIRLPSIVQNIARTGGCNLSMLHTQGHNKSHSMAPAAVRLSTSQTLPQHELRGTQQAGHGSAMGLASCAALLNIFCLLSCTVGDSRPIPTCSSPGIGLGQASQVLKSLHHAPFCLHVAELAAGQEDGSAHTVVRNSALL